MYFLTLCRIRQVTLHSFTHGDKLLIQYLHACQCFKTKSCILIIWVLFTFWRAVDSSDIWNYKHGCKHHILNSLITKICDMGCWAGVECVLAQLLLVCFIAYLWRSHFASQDRSSELSVCNFKYCGFRITTLSLWNNTHSRTSSWLSGKSVERFRRY